MKTVLTWRRSASDTTADRVANTASVMPPLTQGDMNQAFHSGLDLAGASRVPSPVAATLVVLSAILELTMLAHGVWLATPV